MITTPETRACENCGRVPATAQWGGERGCGVCFARNGGRGWPWWCDKCIFEAQIGSGSVSKTDRAGGVS